MEPLIEDLLTHFNIVETQSTLSITLINPNITLQTIQHIQNYYQHNRTIATVEIVIIECANFDDDLLSTLAKAIPKSVKELTLDFTGCESLRGQGFLQLFQRLDGLELTKLSIDIGSVYNINDIILEGLSLLLSNLNGLKELYLDFYQIDQITQEGYLPLIEAISQLEDLTVLYLDFSANQNITEDILEILFGGITHQLKSFTFRILDIEHIGGGSFFKLAEALAQMTQMQSLDLTISTFTNLNHKGIYSIIKSIGKLTKLRNLNLNLSNIDLPQKMITYLTLSQSLKEINLDVSCNRKITFSDFLNLGLKLKNVEKINLNLDFCTGITEDTIQEVVEVIAQQNKCTTLVLRDRNYSVQFQSSVAKSLMKLKSLINVSIFGKVQSKKMLKLREMLYEKQKFILISAARSRKHGHHLVNAQILQLIFNKQQQK